MALMVSGMVARSLITASSDATIVEATRRMVQYNIGPLVVCDTKVRRKVAGVGGD